MYWRPKWRSWKGQNLYNIFVGELEHEQHTGCSKWIGDILKRYLYYWGFNFGAMHFPPYHSHGVGKNTCQSHLLFWMYLNPSWTPYRTKRTKRSSKDFVVSQNDEGLENNNRFVNKLEAKQFQKLEMNEWKNRNCKKKKRGEKFHNCQLRHLFGVVTGLRWLLLVAKCPP